jgi:hypothetical protein
LDSESVTPSPPSGRFIDPNERLLASTIPPPPPSRRERIGRLIAQLRWRDVRRAGDWFHSREARSCLFAALAGAALMFGFYRSEAASAASTALAALQRTEAPSTAVVERASILPEPRALAAVRQPATPAPSTRLAVVADVEPAMTSGDVDRAEPGTPVVLERRPAQAAPRRAATLKKSAGKKVAKKKLVKKKRKAKQSVARASTRATRRSKARRAPRPGPAAWLTDEVRGKGAIASQP